MRRVRCGVAKVVKPFWTRVDVAKPPTVTVTTVKALATTNSARPVPRSRWRNVGNGMIEWKDSWALRNSRSRELRGNPAHFLVILTSRYREVISISRTAEGETQMADRERHRVSASQPKRRSISLIRSAGGRRLSRVRSRNCGTPSLSRPIAKAHTRSQKRRPASRSNRVPIEV